jgi:hypothetical protein
MLELLEIREILLYLDRDSKNINIEIVHSHLGNHTGDCSSFLL